MKETNAKTIEVLERLNIKDKGFIISHSIKLYIRYKELKIKLTNGIWTPDVRHQTSDIRHLTYLLVT